MQQAHRSSYETLHTGLVFSFLQRQNIDFNEWQLFIDNEQPLPVIHESVEHEIKRLPEVTPAYSLIFSRIGFSDSLSA